MRILAVGDTYMPPRYFEQAFAPLEATNVLAYHQVDPQRPFVATTDSERGLREYQGAPDDLIEQMPGVEVLAVHGAPVSDAVLDASEDLRLVCCARGGPVNVDVAALNARELPLVNTPGKNAHAVADQTIAFLIMLARGFPRAQRFLLGGGRVRDNWEGARFIGSDLRRHTLGLVGFGRVGRLVARRAHAFDMDVLIYDPLLEDGGDRGTRVAPALHDLLVQAHFVSVHARATPENEEMFSAAAFGAMRPGAFFVNTARETLVDEAALEKALASGHLAGAALDVFRPAPEGRPHPLLAYPNVVLTPHIGGATHETLVHGAEMIAAEIASFEAGRDLRHIVNPEHVRA